MDGPKTLKSEKLEQLQNGILTPFVTKSALTNSILESVKKMRKCNFALWVKYFPYKTFWNTVQFYKNMSIRYILVWSWRTCLMDKNVIRPSGIEFKWSSTFFFCRMKFKEWKNVPTIAILRSTYLRYWNWLKKVHKSYHLDPNEERGLGLRRTLQFAAIFHEAYEMISIGQDQVFLQPLHFIYQIIEKRKLSLSSSERLQSRTKHWLNFFARLRNYPSDQKCFSLHPWNPVFTPFQTTKPYPSTYIK